MGLSLPQLKSHLWNCAEILRGSAVDRTDWKAYILPLQFFKRICDVCLISAPASRLCRAVTQLREQNQRFAQSPKIRDVISIRSGVPGSSTGSHGMRSASTVLAKSPDRVPCGRSSRSSPIFPLSLRQECTFFCRSARAATRALSQSRSSGDEAAGRHPGGCPSGRDGHEVRPLPSNPRAGRFEGPGAAPASCAFRWMKS